MPCRVQAACGGSHLCPEALLVYSHQQDPSLYQGHPAQALGLMQAAQEQLEIALRLLVVALEVSRLSWLLSHSGIDSHRGPPLSMQLTQLYSLCVPHHHLHPLHPPWAFLQASDSAPQTGSHRHNLLSLVLSYSHSQVTVSLPLQRNLHSPCKEPPHPHPLPLPLRLDRFPTTGNLFCSV